MLEAHVVFQARTARFSSRYYGLVPRSKGRDLRWGVSGLCEVEDIERWKWMSSYGLTDSLESNDAYKTSSTESENRDIMTRTIAIRSLGQCVCNIMCTDFEQKQNDSNGARYMTNFHCLQLVIKVHRVNN